MGKPDKHHELIEEVKLLQKLTEARKAAARVRNHLETLEEWGPDDSEIEAAKKDLLEWTS